MAFDPGVVVSIAALAALGVYVLLRRRARGRARAEGRLGPRRPWRGGRDADGNVIHGGSGDVSDDPGR